MISHAKGQEFYYNIQNKNGILNSVHTTRFWTYLWSSVTERMLKGDRWKGKTYLGCNPPHLCVNLKPGPGWCGLICVYWLKLNCRPSLFQHYYHKMTRNERVDKDKDNRQFLIVNILKLVQNSIQKWCISINWLPNNDNPIMRELLLV
jgi:hypothetical protein